MAAVNAAETAFLGCETGKLDGLAWGWTKRDKTMQRRHKPNDRGKPPRASGWKKKDKKATRFLEITRRTGALMNPILLFIRRDIDDANTHFHESVSVCFHFPQTVKQKASGTGWSPFPSLPVLSPQMSPYAPHTCLHSNPALVILTAVSQHVCSPFPQEFQRPHHIRWILSTQSTVGRLQSSSFRFWGSSNWDPTASLGWAAVGEAAYRGMCVPCLC